MAIHYRNDSNCDLSTFINLSLTPDSGTNYGTPTCDSMNVSAVMRPVKGLKGFGFDHWVDISIYLCVLQTHTSDADICDKVGMRAESHPQTPCVITAYQTFTCTKVC